MERAVSLRHLRCFLAVAESGSFTTASSRLFLTQSALTATIQQLEEAVGLKLFDRTTRRVVMTEAGALFRPQADKILREFDNAVGDLRALAHGQKGHIKVAAIPSVIYQFLSIAIPAFREQFPDVTISLRDAGALRIEQMVLDGEVDFGITARHKGFDDLDYSPLISDRYGVVCRPDHALVQRTQPLRWKDLPSRDYVAFSRDTDVGSFLAAHAAELPIVNDEHDEVSGTTALFALLTTGTSYSIVPALATKAGSFQGLTFRELTDPALSREIFLITRRLRSISPTARHLLEVLLASIERKELPEGVSLMRQFGESARK
ncbi:LysR family transcriptional regulator [Ramlibacter sp. Leaf400]|uniref:LysR family transcriptional regulator n=1 Tax=Ramlibacter sp. Leaf400 TaxID=1736365 RepID=UPI0006FAFE7E|nr:LysR family transcriptional regulator [Ramlibacter sp. Leaf400]KQT14035.1 LysR family transcriptional regulator [Ramlibacter sp. Leaf400]